MINEKLYNKVRIAKFTFDITPSGGSSIGTGSTDVDISSLNAKEILGITFTTGFNFLVCGTNSDFSSNPTTLSIYGYRLLGPSTTAISGSFIVMYTK